MHSLRTSFAAAALAISLLTAHAAFAQKNDLGLEAIVAPEIYRTFGSESRTRFGIEFNRVSSGASLLAQYGTGAGYVDYFVMFRFSGLLQFFHEPFSRGLIYGLGLGGTGSPGFAADRTQTAKKVGFSDVLVNPFVRYLFDINGWVGPFLEIGYEINAARLNWAKDIKAPDALGNRFLIGLGFAFEAERSSTP